MNAVELSEGTEAEEPDWFAEIEFRGYLRDKIPEIESDRRFYPTEPDLKLSEASEREDYLPEGDGIVSVDTAGRDDIEVSSDKIVVPLETTRKVPDGELEEWVKENVLDGMFIREMERKGQTMTCLGVYDSSPYGYSGNRKVHNYDNSGYSTEYRIRYNYDPRPVYVQVPPEHDMNQLNNIWESRRSQSRDLKMLITARDAQTGTGKTTLAVALAKSWDAVGWDASKATLSPSEYVDRYTELESGEVLIGDEMEQMADPRRSMSQQNITLTQYWSTMRQWEVSTICTLPSAAMVDKRLRELMDVRINVIRRGVAVAYEKKIDDHSGEVREKRLHRIRWGAMDDDDDYRELARMKKRHMENFNETAYFMAEDDEEEQKTPEEAVKEKRNKWIREMYDKGYKQKEIAAVFDLSRPRVSQIVGKEGAG